MDKRKAKSKATILVLIFMGSLFAFLASFGYGLRLNGSNSLPHSLFFAYPINSNLSKGMIVSFEHPILQKRIGKTLIGFPGDKISTINENVYVNDFEIGKFQAVSHSGQKYNVIDTDVIPEGFYFVYTTNQESYDSRYKEFGLVKEEWITEALWPVF